MDFGMSYCPFHLIFISSCSWWHVDFSPGIWINPSMSIIPCVSLTSTLKECLLLRGGHISSLLHQDYTLRGRGTFSVTGSIGDAAARVLMPITIAIFRAIYLCAALDAVSVARRVVVATAAVRLDCITSHGGGEARVADICGRGVAHKTIRWDHRAAAQVPVKVLAEDARDAVQGHRIRARVQKADKGKVLMGVRLRWC